MTSIHIPSALFRQLVRRMRESVVEEVAFVATRPDAESNSLTGFDLYLVEPHEFAFQSDHHVSLSDQAQRDIVRWAHERNAGLIEAHAHRTATPAQFSLTDLQGLREWVPHLRWRLAGRPYAALVFADSSYDGIIWSDASTLPTTISALCVEGRRMEPTGRTLRYSTVRKTT